MRKILQQAANAMAGRTIVVVLILKGLAAAVPVPALAADIPDALLSVYTVSDIVVDASAPNAVKAREEALANGQRDAFRILVTRLGAEEDRVPVPDARTMSELVLGVAILEEKTSTVRYVGKAAFTFFPDGVRDLLRRSGFTAVDMPSRPLVVLPLWVPSPGSQPKLWDDPNPWRTAWDTRPKAGLVPLEIPLGDLEDVTAVDPTRATALDPDSLGIITGRYQADDALIARAEALGVDQGTGLPTEIRISAARGRDGRFTFSDTVPVAYGTSLEPALEEAVIRIVAWLENHWREEYARITGGEEQTLALAIHIPGGLGDWLKMRKALDRAQQIKAWSLDILTRTEARVSATIYGDTEQLAASLSAEGLHISGENGQWIIRPGHPEAAPSALGTSPVTSPEFR